MMSFFRLIIKRDMSGQKKKNYIKIRYYHSILNGFSPLSSPQFGRRRQVHAAVDVEECRKACSPCEAREVSCRFLSLYSSQGRLAHMSRRKTLRVQFSEWIRRHSIDQQECASVRHCHPSEPQWTNCASLCRAAATDWHWHGLDLIPDTRTGP